ncbi:MAG: hypothetical protein ABSG46_02805 [Candidatus Binataceae bacterium]
MVACRHQPAPPAAQQVLYASLPAQRTVVILPIASGPSPAPLAAIRETAPDVPVDVGSDVRGEIYVANHNGNVKVYAGLNYDYQLVRTIEGPHTRLQHINAMAVDRGGNIYAADAGAGPGDARVIVFAGELNGNVPPDHILAGPHTGLTSPAGISIDGTGRVFVADHDSGKVLIFESGAEGDTPPIATISTVRQPVRVLVDQELNLYVGNASDHAISVFIPEGSQSWSRSATISAPAIQNPQGIAVDDSAQIAVAVNGGIAFFPSSANGPTAPAQFLSGSSPINAAGIMIK